MKKLYLSHLLEDQEMAVLIEKHNLGIESIEFSISENLDQLPEKIRAYRTRLASMGNPELILHGPFLDLNPMCFDKYVLEATFLRYEQAYEAAVELGASKIVYHSCYIPRVYMLIGWADRVVDFYQKFLEGKSGIQVLMENVQDPKIEPFLQVAKNIEHPDFGICLDLGHAHCYSDYEVTEWARALGRYIKHLHLHDNDRSYDRHGALGSGTVPIGECLKLLENGRQDLTGTYELNTTEDVDSSVKWMKENGVRTSFKSRQGN